MLAAALVGRLIALVVGGALARISRSFALVRGAFALVGGALAGIGGPFPALGSNIAFVAVAVALVGGTVTLVGGTVALVGGTLALLSSEFSGLSGWVALWILHRARLRDRFCGPHLTAHAQISHTLCRLAGASCRAVLTCRVGVSPETFAPAGMILGEGRTLLQRPSDPLERLGQLTRPTRPVLVSRTHLPSSCPAIPDATHAGWIATRVRDDRRVSALLDHFACDRPLVFRAPLGLRWSVE